MRVNSESLILKPRKALSGAGGTVPKTYGPQARTAHGAGYRLRDQPQPVLLPQLEQV